MRSRQRKRTALNGKVRILRQVSGPLRPGNAILVPWLDPSSPELPRVHNRRDLCVFGRCLPAKNPLTERATLLDVRKIYSRSPQVWLFACPRENHFRELLSDLAVEPSRKMNPVRQGL